MKTLSLLALFSIVTIAGCAVSQVQSPPAPNAATAPDSETQALLQKFVDAPTFWQQGEFGEKLVKSGDKSLIPAVAKLLQVPERARRINAARVLAGLGDERGLPAVIRELKDKSSRAVPDGGPINSHGQPDINAQIEQDRYYAAGVLGTMGDKRATPALIELLSDADLNYRAALSLAELGDKRAISPLLLALERPPARKFYSPNTDIKLYAGAALMALGNAKGLPALAQIIRANKYDIARRHAAELLGTYGDAQAIPVLIEALNDKDVEVRVIASRALGEVGDARALPALQKAALDKSAATGRAPLDFHSTFSKFQHLTVHQAATKAIQSIKAKK